MSLIKNEKIKASEVHVTNADGEDLGIMATSEALALAKRLKVDLVCMSLMSSPPACRLIRAGAAKQEAQQARKQEQPSKVKEIRLTTQIEDHDLDTKSAQAERILKAGDSVNFVVKLQGKDGAMAKKLLEGLIRDLTPIGKPKTGIQLSGKQASVQIDSGPHPSRY